MIFVTELKCQKHDHEEAQQPTLVCGAFVSLLGSFGELQSVVGLVGWLVWLLHSFFIVLRSSTGKYLEPSFSIHFIILDLKFFKIVHVF